MRVWTGQRCRVLRVPSPVSGFFGVESNSQASTIVAGRPNKARMTTNLVVHAGKSSVGNTETANWITSQASAPYQAAARNMRRRRNSANQRANVAIGSPCFRREYSASWSYRSLERAAGAVTGSGASELAGEDHREIFASSRGRLSINVAGDVTPILSSHLEVE